MIGGGGGLVLRHFEALGVGDGGGGRNLSIFLCLLDFFVAFLKSFML